MRLVPVIVLAAGLASSGALAAECPGNPNAIGTSRVLAVDPHDHTRIGSMQYNESLPLADHEVVLTFDDGPLPKHTNKVREILASECVRATYFMIGKMAHAYPEEVRKTFEAGHTIGTHSENHPLTFQRMTPEQYEKEIEDGIAHVSMALGDPSELAPFFRIPGLLRQAGVEDYLASRGIMTWSADFPADDWKHIRSQEIVKRALTRLEAKGRGVLLLHDIQPATVAALPVLLHELKARGYKIVHVVPASADQPKTATTPDQWIMRASTHVQWTPMAMNAQPPVASDLPATSLQTANQDALFSPALTLPASPAAASFVRGRASPPVTAEPMVQTGSFRIAKPSSETFSSTSTSAKQTAASRKAGKATAANRKAKNAAAHRQGAGSKPTKHAVGKQAQHISEALPATVVHD